MTVEPGRRVVEIIKAGRTLALGLLVALPLGCKAPTPEPERAEKTLQDALADCTARTGYEPTSAALPERALAPGEGAWRDCARQAIQANIMPKSSVPELYRGLIADDERMTAAVDAGTMTRAERRLRLESSIESIRAAETRAYEDRQAKLMQDMRAQADQQRRQDDIYRITAQAAQMQRIMVAR
jgi:hypothetical protein